MKIALQLSPFRRREKSGRKNFVGSVLTRLSCLALAAATGFIRPKYRKHCIQNCACRGYIGIRCPGKPALLAPIKNMRKVTPTQIIACTFALCVLAFVSFWNRQSIAGMLLVLAAISVLGAGFGHLMNSPCPLDALPLDSPDYAQPIIPPDLLPPHQLAAGAPPDGLILPEAPFDSPAIPGDSEA